MILGRACALLATVLWAFGVALKLALHEPPTWWTVGSTALVFSFVQAIAREWLEEMTR